MSKKVQKDMFYEMGVQFSEIFEGATVEKATEKAHLQKEPSDNAKLKITDQRFVKSNIKLIGEEQDGSKENKKS
jgi:hypothetical protein|tara:strand:- start:428 stop:649 length:222 start_codon:yes stop_codon:yes gene_type:complete